MLIDPPHPGIGFVAHCRLGCRPSLIDIMIKYSRTGFKRKWINAGGRQGDFDAHCRLRFLKFSRVMLCFHFG
jgi:hypothetical protein